MSNYTDENYLDTTYAILRPGCAPRATNVRADKLAAELAYYNDQVPGHIVLGGSGELEGVEVDPAHVAKAVARSER